jgi:UDP-N-acetyl-2-amino-2-deoxyglucuronate dehydrogenase
MRTSIVGCGKVASLHAQAFATLNESEFVAVCDADLSRTSRFVSQFSVSAWRDAASMVRAEKVQVVSICTPHPLHAAAAIAAMEAGAHVLVEKPLAATLADCDRMLAAAKSSGVKLGVVSQRRFMAPVARMKAAIDAGKIGRPVLGTVEMLSWRDEAYYRSDPWRGKWETEGGGVLINQAPHHLDILQWLMGPVCEVTGRWGNLNHPYVEVEDTAVAILRFRSGGLATVTVSLSQQPGLHTKIHIHGSNGASVGAETDTGATFIAGISGAPAAPFNDLWTIPGEELPHSVQQGEPHTLQIHNFLQALREGREPSVNGEEGRKVVQIIAAIYESNRTGASVQF